MDRGKSWANPSATVHRLNLARTHRPFTLVFAFVLPIPGALAIIYGDDVSRALNTISAGVLSRVIGIALLVGAMATVTGLARGVSLYEAAGLTLMSGACTIYGVGVILGLGLGGMVAGPMALAVALAMILRVVSLTTIAREVSNIDE